jgi:hypothetical protein
MTQMIKMRMKFHLNICYLINLKVNNKKMIIYYNYSKVIQVIIYKFKISYKKYKKILIFLIKSYFHNFQNNQKKFLV